MLPVNLLNALKEYALAQRTPLPAAAKDTPSSGPQFEVGQKLQGSVQAQVAPNVFKVNVSGQLVQMQLPPNVRGGDTVALQVVSLLPRLTFSMANSTNPLSTPEQLGATARLLSSLSQQAPEKAYVRAAQSTPLWNASRPPEPMQLAGMLREALSNSGLFYESHQAQWIGGERSIAQLMHEPQNLSPEQAKTVAAAIPDVGTGRASAGDANGPTAKATANDTTSPIAPSNDAAGKTVTAGDLAGKAIAAADTASKAAILEDAASNAMLASSPNAADTSASSQSQPGTSSLPENKTPGIPEHLQPLVQQQLNALETRQMLWQGNVWPGQQMQWEIHEQAPQTPTMEAQRQWVTQVQLDLPNLGSVAATLRLNSAGLSLTLNADTPQTRDLLGTTSTRLVSALMDAGIPVLSTQVTR